MKALPALLALILSGIGCSASTSTNRPDAETTRIETANDFTGVLEGDYYTPLREDEEATPTPGVQYVRVGEYDGPSVVGGQTSVRNAVTRAMSGFICPVRGQAYVMAMIADTGEALSPRVSGSLHPECDARALAVFSDLRFVSARVGGSAVAMPLTIPVRFE